MTQDLSRRRVIGIGAAAAGGALFGRPAAAAPASPAIPSGKKPLVVVWSEGTAPKNVYPDDINGAVAEGLVKSLPKWEVFKASLGDPDQGLPDAVLSKAWVLIWWGHQKHGDVKDELVDKVCKRVKEDGMGFIALHSSHFAKPNKKLMGTACSWGAYIGDSEICKCVVKDPKHPICAGLPKEFTFKHDERYSEPYAVPETAVTVIDGLHTVKGGKPDDKARMGLCFEVGKGKFYYFHPGHETNPVFMDENVRKMMANAVNWCSPKKVM
jgi:trehalose utilization protein